jgi:CO/xanthine dehydrogenase Mo-binding subunit
MNVGKSVNRSDGELKATGKCRFIDDLSFPNMLYGKVFRSEHPHAKVIEIDLREALRVREIVHIATQSEIPGKNIVPVVKGDQPLLASETNYIGEPIALIAGETITDCDRAARFIKVKSEELPAVFNPLESIGAPLP